MSFSTLFILRKNLIDKTGLAPVHLRVSLSYKDRVTLSTGIKITPERWLAKPKRAPNGLISYIKGSTTKIKVLNERLNILESKVHKEYNKLLETNAFITTQDIKLAINNTKTDTIISVCNQLATNKHKESTKETFNYRIKRLKKFLSDEYNIDDLPISVLATKQYRSMGKKLCDWCVYEKGYSDDVTRLMLGLLKSIGDEAVDLTIFDSNPINYTFKGTTRPKDKKEALAIEDVFALEKFDVGECKTLEKIKDIFLFQCYTGLAYIDVFSLTEENILLGIDERNWVIKSRQKTTGVSKIPLIEKAQVILDKYAPNTSEYEGKLLPVYKSRSAYNKYIKKLMAAVGIEKNVSTHTARFTFAEILRASGVALDNIKDVLGHSDKKMSEHYAKITDMTLSNELNKLNEYLKVSKQA